MTAYIYWKEMPPLARAPWYRSNRILKLILYPFVPIIYLIQLHLISPRLTFILIVTVFAQDTLSYIVGKLWGKYQLTEISPRKSWEGTIAGIITAILVLWSFFRIWAHYAPVSFIIFALEFAIVSLVGDLFESWLKRRARVKDSGDILPGHGGFLDRFDSIFFAGIFLYIAITTVLPLYCPQQLFLFS